MLLMFEGCCSLFKCQFYGFLKQFKKADAINFRFKAEWKERKECLEPAFLYIGIKGLTLIEGEVVHSTGATFCKSHSVRVLTIINRINTNLKKGLKPEDIEILALAVDKK